MRSLAHEETIEIAAEPDAVFDLIHDYSRRLEWDPFLKEARLLDHQTAAVGATCRCVARNTFGGLAMEAIYVSFDRPKVAAVKMVNGPAMIYFETRPKWLRPILNVVCSRFFASEVRNR